MKVKCNQDGSLTIDASAEEAALLAGRTQFGNLEELQRRLANQIADAWYAADCPPGDGTMPAFRHLRVTRDASGRVIQKGNT